MNAVRIALSMVALASCAIPARAQAPAPSAASPEKIAVVRTTGRASLVLDATPAVTSIVASKTSDDDAKARLARDALRAVHSRLSAFGKAETITVHVVYERTPDVSPAYGSSLAQTLEHYADVEISGADARGDREKWQSGDDRAPVPAFVRFTVTGELPPR